MTEIRCNFKHYDPPAWVQRTVERLVASLSAEHTGRLGAIVLTDSAAVGRGKTGRVHGRKYARNECRGFYHPEWRGEPAWIELVVDNVVGASKDRLPRVQFLRDLVIARVLYHEIGHHLHATVGSASAGGEDSADDWQTRLSRIHFRRRYWYLRPFFLTVRGVARMLQRMTRWL